MNRFALLLILGSCVVLLAAAGIAAAEDHGDRVCIYNHENFHGHEQCYRPGDEVSDLKHADIESIRVFGNVRAMVFEERDFRGSVVEFNSNIRDLKHVNLTGAKELDHVGSLRVISDVAFNSGKYYEPPDYAFVRSKPYPGTASIDEGVCVYERPRFEGRFQCWGSGTDVSDLGAGNWGDLISSVRVFGHGRLVGFEHKNFQGQRVYIDHDAPDLTDVPMRSSGNWNHEISSFQVQ